MTDRKSKGELELIIEYNRQTMTSLKDECNLDNLTVVLEDLIIRMKEALTNAIDRSVLNVDEFSAEQYEAYLKTGLPLIVKIKQGGSHLCMTGDDKVLIHDIPRVFDNLCLAIQRSLDLANKGVKEKNMQGIADESIFDSTLDDNLV